MQVHDAGQRRRSTQAWLATETPTLQPAPRLSIDAEIGAWLHARTAVNPELQILWFPHGASRVSEKVRSPEHLSVLASRLTEPGRWAVLEWCAGGGGRWCQTMRYPTGWVVDAHDGTSDDFAQRVFRGGPGDYPTPSGRRPPFGFELWQPTAAADLMWTWLHGRISEGCSRTMRHMISPTADHGLG